MESSSAFCQLFVGSAFCQLIARSSPPHSSEMWLVVLFNGFHSPLFRLLLFTSCLPGNMFYVYILFDWSGDDFKCVS